MSELYNGYEIVQGKQCDGVSRIGVKNPDGKIVKTFSYHSYNLLERSKKITRAKNYIDDNPLPGA